MTSRYTHEPVVDVIEADEILEIFATSLTRIETQGPTSRLLFGSRRRRRHGLVEVVTVAVVVPTDALARIARQLEAGDVGLAAGDEGDPEMVRLAN